MKNYLLSRFGFSDGMRTGSTMANNIIVTSLIASAAGFDDTSLVLFSGLSSFFGFILEVPIAYFADERGWRKAVRTSFLLDFIILIFLLVAVWAGAIENRSIFYVAMILRSLSIALANGFERGAYQAAYLNWYEENLNCVETVKDSKLFIDSFRYSLPYRLVVPIIACGLFLILQNFTSVLYSSLFCLSLLAFSKLIGPWKDLELGDVSNEKSVPAEKLSFTSVFLSSQTTFPDLAIYAYGWLVRNFIHAVLIAKSYHLFRELDFSSGSIFAGGSLMALTINFFNLFCSRIFFDKVRYWKSIESIRVIASTGILIISLLGMVVFSYSNNILLQLSVLFLFCLIALTFSDAIRFEIESDIKNISKNGYLASWLSAGNLLQYLVYATIASIASFLGSSPSVIVIFGSFALIGATVVTLKKKAAAAVSPV